MHVSCCIKCVVITASLFLLTLSCLLFSFWMLSKVYFSERLWRILKRREPRFEVRDSSSSMMSLGTFIFFPRSISRNTNKSLKSLCACTTYLYTDQTSDKTNYLFFSCCRKNKPLCMDCWLGVPANMMNEELSSLIIHSCPLLVLWLALRASYCMLIMDMSQVYIRVWDT